MGEHQELRCHPLSVRCRVQKILTDDRGSLGHRDDRLARDLVDHPGTARSLDRSHRLAHGHRGQLQRLEHPGLSEVAAQLPTLGGRLRVGRRRCGQLTEGGPCIELVDDPVGGGLAGGGDVAHAVDDEQRLVRCVVVEDGRVGEVCPSGQQFVVDRLVGQLIVAQVGREGGQELLARVCGAIGLLARGNCTRGSRLLDEAGDPSIERRHVVVLRCGQVGTGEMDPVRCRVLGGHQVAHRAGQHRSGKAGDVGPRPAAPFCLNLAAAQIQQALAGTGAAQRTHLRVQCGHRDAVAVDGGCVRRDVARGRQGSCSDDGDDCDDYGEALHGGDATGRDRRSLTTEPSYRLRAMPAHPISTTGLSRPGAARAAAPAGPGHSRRWPDRGRSGASAGWPPVDTYRQERGAEVGPRPRRARSPGSS